MTDAPLLCARCLKELTPGSGDFFVVRIEAVADPTAPETTLEELANTDHAAEIARLIEQTHGLSEQELMDQVYRRLTIHLCTTCFRQWIEAPADRG